jgi:GNAT superfamily N-acetyltransferase
VTLRAPVALTPAHAGSGFDCGRPSLNQWLAQRALRNQATGASRTYVVCELAPSGGARIVGYYALASGAVAAKAATGRLRRSMPDPIPVVLLARLAVDLRHQGRGLGRALLKDAARRVLTAADAIGIRGLLAHALDDAARGLYAHLGFDPSPLDPLTLMITLSDLRAELGNGANPDPSGI